MSKSEQRFLMAQGEQFLSDGRVRCHAVSKMKMRRMREEYAKEYGEDAADKLTSDDFWPEAQCRLAAIEGTFICNYHGGRSTNIEKRDMISWMPYNLQQVARAFEGQPGIYSRFQDVVQLLSRNAELYQSIEQGGGGSEMWDQVWLGLEMIEEGQLQAGVKKMRSALLSIDAEREVWDEIRENMKLMDKFANTQFRIEKELQTMATTDQVMNMINNVYTVVVDAVTQNVENKVDAERILQRIAGELRRTSGIGSVASDSKTRVIDSE